MIWTAGEEEPYVLLQYLLAAKAAQPDRQGQLPLEHLRGERMGSHALPEPLPAMARTRQGKPYFPGRPDLHFSLSHSRGLSLCALSDVPVGADIEFVRPRRAQFPRYTLSDREYAWYESRGRSWDDFYRLWTMKEARVKCTGEGIFHRPARQVSIPLLSGGEQEWEGFRFTALAGEIQLVGDFFGAICEKTNNL